MSVFQWTKKAIEAALALADGETQAVAAERAEVTDRTVRRWLSDPGFAEEVDRLTFLTGIALKAERLRLAKRVIAKLEDRTNKDLLEWLKYAQGETDGVKLDLAQLLAAVTTHGDAVADSGSGSPAVEDD